MDISIIIPVYNVEKYLIRCLDSIFNQEFSGTFEVIAVDDGSTDSSLSLLKEYQKNEQRLQVIEHLVNKKLSIARNTGMSQAIGKYIMNIDSDDYLLPGSLEKLRLKSQETNADIIAFDFVRESTKGKLESGYKIDKTFITDDKLLVQKYFYGNIVSKLIKSDISKDLISGSIPVNSGEDLLYCTELLLRANKICVVADKYYVYCINDFSITNRKSPDQTLRTIQTSIYNVSKVLKSHNCSAKFTVNILRYLKKWIILANSRILFQHKVDVLNYDELLCTLSDYPNINQSMINDWDHALKSKFYCALQLGTDFGVRGLLSLFKYILVSRNKKQFE